MTVTIVTTVQEKLDDEGNPKVTISASINTTNKISNNEIINAGRVLQSTFELKDQLALEQQMINTILKMHAVNHAEKETEKIMDKLSKEFEK